MRRAENLARLRAALGLSQAQLAALVGASQPQIQRLEKGLREFSAEWAEQLAPHLQVSVIDLMFPNHEAESGEVVELPVLGTSHAGDWRDISVMDDIAEPDTINVVRDQRFKGAKQYALRVAGDSMDRLFPDGSYVIVVDFADSGLSLKPGMVVHVEQRMSGTSLVETTIKEVGADLKTLLPRSSNAKHLPVILDGDEATEVVVRGIVTGVFHHVLY